MGSPKVSLPTLMTLMCRNYSRGETIQGRKLYVKYEISIGQNARRKPNGLDFSGVLRAKTKPESVAVTSASSMAPFFISAIFKYA